MARIKSQVESALAVCEDTNVHHRALVGKGRTAFQMEQHRHVVLVEGGIEASDVDRTTT